MTGWKTVAGACIIAGGAVLRYYGMVEVADSIMALGVALGLIGIGHKLDKASK